MPIPPSAKTKSQHGNSGPEDNNPVVVTDSPGIMGSLEKNHDCEKSPTPDQPDVVAVVDSGDTAAISPMSESDRKLATKMTRAISDHLGLSGRSRSVRV
jgi:hypothetical protein